MDRLMLVDPRGGRWLVDVPTRVQERMRGLIGRGPLAPGHAMLLLRTRSIHTFGMRFPLKVAFLDGAFRVVEVKDVRPRRIVLPRRRVRHVLEAGEGADLRTGDAFERPVGAGQATRARRSR